MKITAMAAPWEILVLREEKLSPEVLRRLVADGFEDMVKYVVDVKRGVIAIGGELHADAEKVLIEDGSSQPDLWGANFHPSRPPEKRIVYTSLINIRPRAGNRGMELLDPDLRRRVRELSERLILGSGDELP